jgi:hypothetical protein
LEFAGGRNYKDAAPLALRPPHQLTAATTGNEIMKTPADPAAAR